VAGSQVKTHQSRFQNAWPLDHVVNNRTDGTYPPLRESSQGSSSLVPLECSTLGAAVQKGSGSLAFFFLTWVSVSFLPLFPIAGPLIPTILLFTRVTTFWRMSRLGWLRILRRACEQGLLQQSANELTPSFLFKYFFSVRNIE
jgi:hypothetical protein